MVRFGIRKLFTAERKFFIRLDKNYKGSEPDTFFPHIEFVKNELTGCYNPQIEIFDSIYRATHQLWYEDKLSDEEKIDVTEINGEQLKAFIEKLNSSYGKNFRIKYHLRNKETLWSEEFSSILPKLYKIIREDYIATHGFVNIIQILIMIVIWILTLWMEAQVPY